MMELNDGLECFEGRGDHRVTGNRVESTGIQASKELRSKRSFSIEDILQPDFGSNSGNAKVREERFIFTDSVQSIRSLFPKLFGNLFNSRNLGDLTLFNRSLFSAICSESCSGTNDKLLGTKEPSLREREVNKVEPRDDLKCLSGNTTKSRNIKRSRKLKENAVDVVIDSLPSRTVCTPTGDRGCNEMKTVASTEGRQHPVTIQEIPAWVYCTRYSDRPSAGRRTKRNKEAKRRKNEKRSRTQFTGQQLNRLKAESHANRYLTDERRLALADQLGLDTSQIKVWFQNRRANLKKSSGVRNVLAMKLMAEGLYNHALNSKNTQGH